LDSLRGLFGGLTQIFLTHDIVTVENAARLVTRGHHCYPFWHPSPFHINYFLRQSGEDHARALGAAAYSRQGFGR